MPDLEAIQDAIAAVLDPNDADAEDRARLLAEILLGDEEPDADVHYEYAEDKPTPEETDESAGLIAEVLYHLYGDKALEHLAQTFGEDFDAFAAGWSASDHPRGAGGRFIPRGSPAAVAAAKEVVGRVLKGDHSADADDVTNHLAILTVKQLRQLHAANGVKKIPSYTLRQHLTEAVRDRLTTSKELNSLRDEFKKVKGARPPDSMGASALKKQIELAQGQGVARK